MENFPQENQKKVSSRYRTGQIFLVVGIGIFSFGIVDAKASTGNLGAIFYWGIGILLFIAGLALMAKTADKNTGLKGNNLFSVIVIIILLGILAVTSRILLGSWFPF